jgi:hypothetical protein
MTKFLITTSLIFLTIISFGQRKVILTKGHKRAVIKPDKQIGFTLKGQPFTYDKWTTICKPCDTLVQKDIWIVDSINPSYFMLKQIIYYSYDTLTMEQILSNPVKCDLVSTLKENGKEIYVCKIPQYNRLTIYYDSISYLTFSPGDNSMCNWTFFYGPLVASAYGFYGLANQVYSNQSDNKNLWLYFTMVIAGTYVSLQSFKIYNNNVHTYDLKNWTLKTK